MSRPIKYLSLQKDELLYEVQLRGKSGSSVVELRRLIVDLAKEQAAEDILESHLEAPEDLAGVKASMIKSQTYLANLKAKMDKTLYLRTENLLNHIYHRLNRIQNVPDEVDKIYKLCHSNLLVQYSEFKTLASATTSDVSEIKSTSSAVVVTCDKTTNAELANLKYSGKTCVRSFIQKVNEFIQVRNISKEKLLTFAYEIFTGDALHWFRCVKDRVESWDELVVLLKNDFGQKDYDYRLLAEIRARTQGEHENITIYLSIMHGLFARLDKALSQQDQLEIIRHNIRPCYASTLAAVSNITDLETLKQCCRNYEDVQSCLKQFREPPKPNSNTLAPEFAYNQPNTSPGSYIRNNYNNQNRYNNQNPPTNNNYYRNCYATNNNKHEINKHNAVSVNAVSIDVDAVSPRNVFCPRCRKSTHSLRQCKEPHFPVCFKCGKKDVRYPECPVCHKYTGNSKN
ncbi:uncharacterized protein LOC126367339 [Pectinophora gossypiella]|uniref:uncharacterized protein LOC126367339 n=1 Tax=Pectinophora gossypiella TaxID=13191 RepID=UPI00214F5F95|nr:uncharacterized protein LOC126367339 [Pectinophora gossypiella]